MTEVAQIIDQLRLRFPLRLQLENVITGEPYVLERENLISMLVIDAANAVVESQLVPGFFAEMARAHADAKSMAARKQMELKRWKAQKRMECVRVAKSADPAGKPLSNDAQETYYRAHDEYPVMNRAADDWKAIAEMLGDLKSAFEMKQYCLRDIHTVVGGHNRIAGRSADAQERVKEYEESREMMDRATAEMQSLLQKDAPPPPASADDGDDGEESDAAPEASAATPSSTKKPRTTRSKKGAK